MSDVDEVSVKRVSGITDSKSKELKEAPMHTGQATARPGFKSVMVIDRPIKIMDTTGDQKDKHQGFRYRFRNVKVEGPGSMDTCKNVKDEGPGTMDTNKNVMDTGIIVKDTSKIENDAYKTVIKKNEAAKGKGKTEKEATPTAKE